MRELNDDEDISNSSNQNDTLNANSESSTSTNSTERLISIENVSFKTSNSTKDSSKTNKKTKTKSKKTRVNREILTTLLSRKKLYKMLQHKLEMYVRSKIVISIIGYSKILLILGLGLTEKSAY